MRRRERVCVRYAAGTDTTRRQDLTDEPTYASSAGERSLCLERRSAAERPRALHGELPLPQTGMQPAAHEYVATAPPLGGDVRGNRLTFLFNIIDVESARVAFEFMWGVGVNRPIPVKDPYPAVITGDRPLPQRRPLTASAACACA